MDTVKLSNHLSPHALPGLEVGRASLSHGEGRRYTQHFDNSFEEILTLESLIKCTLIPFYLLRQVLCGSFHLTLAGL